MKRPQQKAFKPDIVKWANETLEEPTKLDEGRRDDIIEGIINDVVNDFYNYQEFIEEAVRYMVSNWNDEQLLAWIGENA